MQGNRTGRQRRLIAAAVAALGIMGHQADAINITMNFNAAASNNPAFDPTGAGLQSIMNHVRGVYNDIFEDAHNITITYRWANSITNNPLAAHTLNSQGGSPNRETAGTILFNTNFTWFIDPTPADNSEYNMQQILWRDLTATQRTNFYNAGANTPDTFEAAFRGAAVAGAPANAINGTDLLSVAFHEVGHALGMSAANTATQAQTGDGDYDFNSIFVFGRTLAARTASSTNIAHLAGTNTLMFPSIGTGLRRLPSHTDLFSMASGHQYTLLDVPRREFYGGSNWNTPGNWSGNQVPGSADDTFVRNPGSLITMSLSANGFCNDLYVGEGAWVSTSTNTLFVFGEATIDRAGAGASTQLRVNSGGTLSATRVTATNGGTLTLLGGVASVGTLTTTTSGGMVGEGTVIITGQLMNNGTISTSGGTLALNTTGSGSLNLDGNIGTFLGGETGVVNVTGGNLVVNANLTDAFNGTINVSASNRAIFNVPWELSASTGLPLFLPAGRLNLNGGTNAATAAVLAGSGTATLAGIINVTGQAQILAASVLQSPTVNVSAGGVLLSSGAMSSTSTSAINKSGPGAWTIAATQSHPAGAILNVNDGTIVMTTNAGAGGQNLTVNVNGGTMSFNTTNRIAAMNVGSGAYAVVPGTGRVLNTRSLAIDGGSSPTGKVNLVFNAMVIDYTAASPLNTVKAQIASGYSGGAWTGDGIITSAGNASTHGLGYAEAGAIFNVFPANFLGETVDNTSVLIRYTRYGDANLDGLVNLSDFNRLAANFGSSNAVWSQGDFNYDGLVNLADFNRLAANFGLAASGTEAPTPDDWASLAAAVPEPGALSVAAIGALALVRRRRR